MNGTKLSIKDKKLNEELVYIESKIADIKRNLGFQGKEITTQIIKDLYIGKVEKDTELVEYYQAFIDRIEKLSNQYSHVVIGKYKNNLQRIKNFLATQKVHNVTLKNINYKWLGDFDYYMLTTATKQYERPLGRNTANKQHDWLRAILIKDCK